MGVVRDQTIDAINEYAKTLSADDKIDAACSLSLFDCPGHTPDGSPQMALDVIIDGQPIKEWPTLARKDYEPRGSTPLNDAVLATIERMEKEWHRPGERICLTIMTDGHENSSKATTKDVKGAIERCQGKGWMVIFLGANIDAFDEGVGQRGTSAANTMQYDTANMKASLSAVARSHASYAATGQADRAGFTEFERQAAMQGAKGFGVNKKEGGEDKPAA